MPSTEESVHRAGERVLAGLVGPGAVPRADQLLAASALVVHGRRALVVQATGWGKSAVYWMATRALRDAGAGPALVVSPLLALMRDQVDAARRAGLHAVTVNSSNVDQWEQVHRELANGSVDVLLTSPERLANPHFASDVLPWLLPGLGLLVIDEAHCISSWGHDFRPDYRRIASLLTGRPDLPVLATTATANDRVTADVSAQLGPGTLVLRGTLARESLHLSVTGQMGVVEAFGWVDGSLPALPGSGIVYVATPQRADALAGFLWLRGYEVRAYHGQVGPEERLVVEGELRANQVKAVVATSALGMGYDKPDLGFVVHVGSPGSPVDYYQQVGRAGRALDSALVVLIPTPEDERLWRYFATATIPREDDAQAVLDLLAESGGPMQVPAISLATGIAEGRLGFLMKVLAVEAAVEAAPGGWIASDPGWSFDRQRYDELLAAREREARLMRAYARSSRCLETVLREALDDPVSGPCGRCSACGSAMPAGLQRDPDPTSVRAARDFLRGIDVVLEPRKMWTAGLSRTGRIPADQMAAEGRALAFAADPGWPDVEAFIQGPDQDAPGWLLDGILDVLDRWSTRWPARPTLVVPIPSTTKPRLIGSLASSISQHLGIPIIDAIAITGPPDDGKLSAKARAAYQEPRIAIASDINLAGNTVLLLDDRIRTGWTTTIAAAHLRQAGATHVLPLAIHKQPTG